MARFRDELSFDDDDAREVSFTQQTTAHISERLDQFIEPQHVTTRRVSSNRTLTQITAEKSLLQAARVFGANGFSTTVLATTREGSRQSGGDGQWTISHGATVAVVLKDGTRHEDWGFCESAGYDRFETHIRSKQGAIADARKRALRVFGNATGNCLYNARGFAKHVEDTRWRRAEAEEQAALDRESERAQREEAERLARTQRALAAEQAHRDMRRRWLDRCAGPPAPAPAPRRTRAPQKSELKRRREWEIATAERLAPFRPAQRARQEPVPQTLTAAARAVAVGASVGSRGDAEGVDSNDDDGGYMAYVDIVNAAHSITF